MTHLIDLSAVPDHCCNHGLEALHKAIAEQPSESLIWTPHDNPWLAALCEDFTRDGEARLLAALEALLAALGIVSSHEPLLRKADPWPPEKLAAVKARLQKPLADYAPSDWLALIDLIIQTKLSPVALDAQAAWLAYRAQLAARLDALAHKLPGLAPTAALLALVTKAAHHAAPPLTTTMKSAWEWAKARIGNHLTLMTDSLRAKVSGTVIAHIQEHGLAARGKLEQSLRDDFGTLNRDWRRVAITEAGEVANQVYLGEFPDGTRIQRLEAYEGACPFCKKLNGQIFIWSTEPLGDEFGWTHVWPGKTNVGRSSSPRKQTPEGLVERTESELWWPAAGVQHPHCRGRWNALMDAKAPPGVDQDFADWVRAEIEKSVGVKV